VHITGLRCGISQGFRGPHHLFSGGGSVPSIYAENLGFFIRILTREQKPKLNEELVDTFQGIAVLIVGGW
jgi:hypothetical protein